MQCLPMLPMLGMWVLAFTFCGHVLFGTTSPTFSRIVTASGTVNRLAFGDFDYESLNAPVNGVASAYNIALFLVMMILVANVILALVTSAEANASQLPPEAELANLVCARIGNVMYGSFTGFLFSWARISAHNKALKKLNDASNALGALANNNTSNTSAVTCLRDGRLFLPSECLLAAMDPFRADESLVLANHRWLPGWLFPSLVPYVLERHHEHKTLMPKDEARDRMFRRKLEVGGQARQVLTEMSSDEELEVLEFVHTRRARRRGVDIPLAGLSLGRRTSADRAPPLSSVPQADSPPIGRRRSRSVVEAPPPEQRRLQALTTALKQATRAAASADDPAGAPGSRPSSPLLPTNPPPLSQRQVSFRGWDTNASEAAHAKRGAALSVPAAAGSSPATAPRPRKGPGHSDEQLLDAL